ncbi:MAG: PQQ-binding-like beta-propeller repeat protein [Chthoniobacter sp.]
MNPASTPLASPRRRWPRFPIVVVALGAAGIAYTRFRPEMERNIQTWQTVAIILLVVVLNFLWFLCTRRFSGRTRLIGLAVAIVLVFGLKQTLRVDGTASGIGLPRLAWRWSAPPLPQLEHKPGTPQGGGPIADEARLAQAADVPQFFGPNRDGLVTGAKLARDWKTAPPKELWRQPIGAGWSAFAVVQGRAYTQEQRGDEELVTCYDLFTGKLLWAHADKTCFTQWQSGAGPHATPTVDAGHVYSYGATGLLNCLDAATGQPIWQRSVLEENKLSNLEWGLSASPLLVDDKVVVTGGNTQGAALFAYHRDTGAPLWQTGNDKASYASPMLATFAGQRVILSNNARGFSASDPAAGNVLLDCTWGAENRPKASQPVVIGTDRVFVSAGYGLGCHLFQIQAGAGGALTASELWRSLRMKTQFNTPAVRDTHLYGLDDGRLACVDLATGDRVWKNGNFGSGQSLLVDDLLIVQSENGPVHLAAAKRKATKSWGRSKPCTARPGTTPRSPGAISSCATTARWRAMNCRW